MSHFYMRHVILSYESCHITICDMTYSDVWNESLKCLTRIVRMNDKTHPHVFHNLLVCLMTSIHVCEINCCEVWQSVLRNVTWPVQSYDMSHACYPWHCPCPSLPRKRFTWEVNRGTRNGPIPRKMHNTPHTKVPSHRHKPSSTVLRPCRFVTESKAAVPETTTLRPCTRRRHMWEQGACGAQQWWGRVATHQTTSGCCSMIPDRVDAIPPGGIASILWSKMPVFEFKPANCHGTNVIVFFNL